MSGIDAAADVARALADSTRVRILVALCDRPLCVCELVQLMEVGQPSVSRHLGILQSAGLVTSARNGRYVEYRHGEVEPGSFAHQTLQGLHRLSTVDPDAAALRAGAGKVDRGELKAMPIDQLPVPKPCCGGIPEAKPQR